MTVVVWLGLAGGWGGELPARAVEEEGRGEQFADDAMRFRRMQHEDEKGNVRPVELIEAAEDGERLRRAASSVDDPIAGIERGTWNSLGPGNVGGRTRAIAVHPTTPDVMWAGSASGGIWKTTNGGVSWDPLDDFMANLRVATLIVDPDDPDVLYAGTGESFTKHWQDGIVGAGVFRSTNGGRTWDQLATTTSTDWNYVNRLAFDPNDSDVLLAATNSGIWRTADAGATTWTRTLATRATDLDFHPTNSNLAVAGGTGAAWYTTNGGASWQAATGLPSGRVEVAYARSAPAVVYASVDANGGEVWRSTNGGQSYALRNTGSNFLAGQGSYDNALWVDPTNSETLVVGGIDLWRSTSGGPALIRISDWGSEQVNHNSAHADHHAIVEHPGFNGTSNRIVFFGNDGGVYKSADVYAAAATTGWQELNNRYAVTQFYSGAGNATSGTIVGGTQDNGTPAFGGGTETWGTVFGGDGGYVAADPTSTSLFYGEYVWLRIFRNSNGGASGAGSGFIHGSSGSGNGDCTKSPPYVIQDACSPVAANFIAPFVLDPNNANRILAGGASLWRTNDARTANTSTTGPQWARIKLPTNPVSYISAIAVAPGNSSVIWVGHNNGLIYRTTNGTAASPTWTRVDLQEMPSRMTLRLTIDPRNHNVVYAAFSGFAAQNLWRTTDGGATWSIRTGSGAATLPDAPVRSVVVHPTNSSFIYAGTEIGVFASEDAGATWRVPHDGPANVSADELFWMGTTLVAATHGRGMFSTDVAAVRPPNDGFANAHTLTGTSVARSGDTNVGATKQSGEPNHAGNAGGGSVWYRWTPAASGQATIHTRTSGFDTTLAVYTGDALNDLTLVQANDDETFPTVTTSLVSFNAVAGTTYRIAVDGFRNNAGAIARGAIALNLAQSVAAAQPLTVSRAGFGNGTVTSNPAGIACGADCTQDYGAGTEVTLTAAAAAGSTFAGWSGACTGAAATCVVSMGTARSVTATFDLIATTQPLTVSRAGSGSGTVTSSPAGIDCGADCAQDFATGTVVTLTAAAAAGSTFSGWSGGCTGTAATCQITMSEAQAASATFGAVGGGPANDAFAARESLAGPSGTRGGTTRGASKEPTEPNHAGNGGGASVWYEWTAPASGQAVIHTRTSPFDTLLGVYTGSSVGALTLVASSDDEQYPSTLTSMVEFGAVAGTQYRIAVDGYNDGTGAASDDVNIAWQLTADTVAPADPALTSPSHAPSVWAADATVEVRWDGASDGGTGVDGFSYGWDTSPATVPDMTKDAEETATGVTTALADGNSHWFHLRTRDNAGNWSAAVHLGPFFVDAAAPSSGALGSLSHLPNVLSFDATVDVVWPTAADAASGVDGFSYAWDSNPGTEPDTIKDAEQAVTAATSPPLPAGSHYFHLRTRDNAGNWSAASHAGPFVIAAPLDATAPTDPRVTGSSHAAGIWSGDGTVDVTWSGAADGDSGVDGFSLHWDTVPNALPDTAKELEESATGATSPPLTTGSSHYLHLRTRDNAGNWSAATHAGPFWIDATAPADPSARSGSHVPGVRSSDNTVALRLSGAADSGSGVDGFSFHWDGRPRTLPDTTKDAEESARATTSPRLAAGTHYFHLRTRDNVGNWTATVHLGPFVIARRCIVPAVRGKRLAAARRLLRAARCPVGRVKRARSRRVAAGRVIGQRPRAGTQLRRRSAVGLVVSRRRA